MGKYIKYFSIGNLSVHPSVSPLETTDALLSVCQTCLELNSMTVDTKSHLESYEQIDPRFRLRFERFVQGYCRVKTGKRHFRQTQQRAQLATNVKVNAARRNRD